MPLCADPSFRIAKGGTSATPPPLFNFTKEEEEVAGPALMCVRIPSARAPSDTGLTAAALRVCQGTAAAGQLECGGRRRRQGAAGRR